MNILLGILIIVVVIPNMGGLIESLGKPFR